MSAIRRTDCMCFFCCLPEEIQEELCRPLRAADFLHLMRISKCWQGRYHLFGCRGAFLWADQGGPAVPTEVDLDPRQTLRAVACGGAHTLLLTARGELLAQGRNHEGQLGDGTTTDRTAPVRVALPRHARVTRIAAGYHFSLAVTAEGTVYAWGANHRGQLGDGSTAGRTTPVRVALPGRATRVAAGNAFALALTARGDVFAWGSDSGGQLGSAGVPQDACEQAAHRTVDLPETESVAKLAAGWHHGLFLTSSGALYTCPQQPATFPSARCAARRTHCPVPHRVPLASPAHRIAAGAEHALALTSRGVLSWGRVLGAPSLVLARGVRRLAAGGRASLALLETGEIYAHTPTHTPTQARAQGTKRVLLPLVPTKRLRLGAGPGSCAAWTVRGGKPGAEPESGQNGC